MTCVIASGPINIYWMAVPPSLWRNLIATWGFHTPAFSLRFVIFTTPNESGLSACVPIQRRGHGRFPNFLRRNSHLMLSSKVGPELGTATVGSLKRYPKRHLVSGLLFSCL